MSVGRVFWEIDTSVRGSWWAHTYVYIERVWWLYTTGLQSRPTISRHYDRIMIVIRGAQKAQTAILNQLDHRPRLSVENRSITLWPRCNYDHLKRYHLISFPIVGSKRLRGARSFVIIETVLSLLSLSLSLSLFLARSLAYNLYLNKLRLKPQGKYESVRAIFAGLRLRAEDTRHSARSTSTPVIDRHPRDGKKSLSTACICVTSLLRHPFRRMKKEDGALPVCVWTRKYLCYLTFHYRG